MPITPKKGKGLKRFKKSGSVTKKNQGKGAFDKKIMQKGGGEFGKVSRTTKRSKSPKKYVETTPIVAQGNGAPPIKKKDDKMAVKRQTTTGPKYEGGPQKNEKGKGSPGARGSGGSAGSAGSVDRIDKANKSIVTRKRNPVTGDKNERYKDKGSTSKGRGTKLGISKARKKSQKSARKNLRRGGM